MGAAIRLSGTAQVVAIAVAALNGLSLLGQLGEAGEPAGATSAVNFFTAVAGLRLLVFSFGSYKEYHMNYFTCERCTHYVAAPEQPDCSVYCRAPSM